MKTQSLVFVAGLLVFGQGYLVAGDVNYYCGHKRRGNAFQRKLYSFEHLLAIFGYRYEVMAYEQVKNRAFQKDYDQQNNDMKHFVFFYFRSGIRLWLSLEANVSPRIAGANGQKAPGKNLDRKAEVLRQMGNVKARVLGKQPRQAINKRQGHVHEGVYYNPQGHVLYYLVAHSVKPF